MGRRSLKYDLLEEQSGLCFYCQSRLDTRDRSSFDFLTIDHIIPVSVLPERKGDPSNKVAACYLCNKRKSDYIIPLSLWADEINLGLLLRTGRCPLGGKRDLLLKPGDPEISEHFVDKWSIILLRAA